MSASRRRVPDRIKPKIPMKVSWPPTIRVDERYGPDEWEQNDYPLRELPPDAQEAFLRLVGVPESVKERGIHPDVPGDPEDYPDFADSNVRVYECDECGYLTMSDALKATNWHDYECGNCGNPVDHNSFGSKGGFTQVWPPGLGVDEEDVFDPRSEAAENRPNHPSHLGRIRNQMGAGLSGGQMVARVRDALEEFYKNR